MHNLECFFTHVTATGTYKVLSEEHQAKYLKWFNDLNQHEWERLFADVTAKKTFNELPEVVQAKYFQWCEDFNNRDRASSVASSSAPATPMRRAASPLPFARDREPVLASSPIPRRLQKQAAPERRYPSISQSSQGQVDPELIDKLAEMTGSQYKSYKQQQKAADQTRNGIPKGNQQQQQQQQHRQRQAAPATTSRTARLVDNIVADDSDDDRNRHNQPIGYDNDAKKELRRLRTLFATEMMKFGEKEKLYQLAAREAEARRAELTASSVKMLQLQNQIEQQELDLEELDLDLDLDKRQGGGGGGGGHGHGHGHDKAWEGPQRRYRRRGHGGDQDGA